MSRARLQSAVTDGLKWRQRDGALRSSVVQQIVSRNDFVPSVWKRSQPTLLLSAQRKGGSAALNRRSCLLFSYRPQRKRQKENLVASTQPIWGANSTKRPKRLQIAAKLRDNSAKRSGRQPALWSSLAGSRTRSAASCAQSSPPTAPLRRRLKHTCIWSLAPAPAIRDAIFAATGKRVRELPVKRAKLV